MKLILVFLRKQIYFPKCWTVPLSPFLKSLSNWRLDSFVTSEVDWVKIHGFHVTAVLQYPVAASIYPADSSHKSCLGTAHVSTWRRGWTNLLLTSGSTVCLALYPDTLLLLFQHLNWCWSSFEIAADVSAQVTVYTQREAPGTTGVWLQPWWHTFYKCKTQYYELPEETAQTWIIM